MRSQLEERQKKQKGRPARNKWADLGASLNVDKAQAKQNAEETSTQKREVESKVRQIKKELGTLQAAQTLARQEHNSSKSQESYQALQEARVEVRALRRELHDPDATLKRLRKETYMWNKIATAPDSAQLTGIPAAVVMTTPTWDWRTVEDDTKHIDISELRSACMEDGKALVFSGTDYGVRTMSETVPMSEGQFQDHLKYFEHQSGK